MSAETSITLHPIFVEIFSPDLCVHLQEHCLQVAEIKLCSVVQVQGKVRSYEAKGNLMSHRCQYVFYVYVCDVRTQYGRDAHSRPACR